MRCPQCASDVPEGMRFCGVCGTPLEAQRGTPPQQPAPRPAEKVTRNDAFARTIDTFT